MASSEQVDKTILQWLASQRSAMLDLLEEVVNVDSGSYDKSGVDQVGKHIIHFLDQHKIATELILSSRFGDAILANIGLSSPRDRILVLGHRDTVFPKGEASQRPFRIDGARAYGPGVADMKAGLVMNCFVLAALNRLGIDAPRVTTLFTGDEEIASPFSRAIIEQHALNAVAVFNSEPGRGNGSVVTGRKGGVFMRFEICGKAAHSGANFESGVSAISELAHKVLALNALTNAAIGVTLNVGLVGGGEAINTVAPSASGEVEFRFVRAADRDPMIAAIETIMAKAFVKGTTTKIEIKGEFLPLAETRANKLLFDHYAKAAQSLGFNASSIITGACADSGFAAATGTPTICAIGPDGGMGHTPEEYVEIDSIVPRAQALALAILNLPTVQRET